MIGNKIISRILSKCPAAVWRLRHFKHFHNLVKLNQPFQEIPNLWTYVIRASLYNRNNKRWALMADKYAVRKEIEKIIGDKYLIPLYGHWNDPEEIDFDALKPPYVLKTNNGCATNIFVHEPIADKDRIVGALKKMLDYPYPQLSGQLHYSLIPPCVIAEKLMLQDKGATSLTDYKIHCVNGEPIRIYVFKDRDEKTHFDFKVMAFDKDWNEYPEVLEEPFRASAGSIPKPAKLDELLNLARTLSTGEEYVRVDFYIIDDKIYFGEMTYTPDTAMHPAYPLNGMDVILDRIKQDRKDGKSHQTF